MDGWMDQSTDREAAPHAARLQFYGVISGYDLGSWAVISVKRRG